MPFDPGINVPDPTQQQPVTAAMKVVSNQPGHAVGLGEQCAVYIRVRILPSFHIYGLNKSGTENTPTRLELTLPKGIKTKSRWAAREPKKAGKALIYEDEVQFVTTLLVSKKTPPGKHTIKCEMEYQVCDEELCWPPAKLPLATEIEVLPSK